MMFTYTSKAALRVEGEALIDGGWVPFDPITLFPTVWGSGPRYARFGDNPRVMTVVAASTCVRHPGTPARVRYLLATWEKRLGSLEPAGRVRREEVIDWTCGDSVTLPDGRVLP